MLEVPRCIEGDLYEFDEQMGGHGRIYAFLWRILDCILPALILWPDLVSR